MSGWRECMSQAVLFAEEAREDDPLFRLAPLLFDLCYA
jgi:hypothetical protein